MKAELTCPLCAAELSIEQLFAHAETRQAFARLAMVSLPLGGRLLAYVGLFAPAKNRMSIARKVKLLEELLPDVEREAIERKGREWDAPREAWSDAIEQMLVARDASKLTLPITSHGYLYEILAGMADKAESRQEQQVEKARQERRAPVLSGAVAVSAVLDGAMGAIAGTTSTPAPPPGPSLYARRVRAEIEAHKARFKESS